jgi:hypothetical protein
VHHHERIAAEAIDLLGSGGADLLVDRHVAGLEGVDLVPP